MSQSPAYTRLTPGFAEPRAWIEKVGVSRYEVDTRLVDVLGEGANYVLERLERNGDTLVAHGLEIGPDVDEREPSPDGDVDARD